MSKAGNAIPHALAKALQQIDGVLNTAIAQWQERNCVKNNHELRQSIERFVNALYQAVPSGRDELQRRAMYVEIHCGPGSAFDVARTESISKYRGRPRKPSGSKSAIERLRDVRTTPKFLHEITGVGEAIEIIQKGKQLNLSNDARQAFSKWRSACRAVKGKAELLEVDGCRFLFHVHAGCEDSASAENEVAQTDLVGPYLESIKDAVESMVDWAGDPATRESRARSDAQQKSKQPDSAKPKDDRPETAIPAIDSAKLIGDEQVETAIPTIGGGHRLDDESEPPKPTGISKGEITADPLHRLIHKIFAPALDLVAHLSHARNEAEAGKRFDREWQKCWGEVGKALDATDANSLPGQDLKDAFRDLAAIRAETETQCNTFEDVAIYLFDRLVPLKQAAGRGWTAAKQGGIVPEGSFPIEGCTPGNSDVTIFYDVITSTPSYEELARELLGVDHLPLAPPRFPIHENDPVHLPGGLTDQDDQNLRLKICRLTNLDPKDWPTLNEADRIVWMHRALDTKTQDDSLLHSAESGTETTQGAIEPKKKSVKGEAAAKICSYLLKHHEYKNGCCGKYEFAGVNEISRNANVGSGSVTNFFNKNFSDGGKDGHQRYKSACNNKDNLNHSMKILAGDLKPSILWNPLSHDISRDDKEDDEEI